MSVLNVKCSEVVQLPLGAALCNAKTTTLVKTTDLELIRLVLPAGKVIPLHQAPGEITVQCLEGRVAFTAEGHTQELTAGQLLHLMTGAPHALRAIEDTSLLLTLVLSQVKAAQPFDVVQEASEESFPASDAPAW